MMTRTKTIATIAYIGITALLAAATSPTAAQDVQIQSVVAIDGKVDCLQTKAGTTHPCEGFTPPSKLAVGETFSADGKTRQIGIIRAVQFEKDMAQGIKKGDWICVAAETLEDLPVDQSRDRTWLTIMEEILAAGSDIRCGNCHTLDASSVGTNRVRCTLNATVG